MTGTIILLTGTAFIGLAVIEMIVALFVFEVGMKRKVTMSVFFLTLGVGIGLIFASDKRYLGASISLAIALALIFDQYRVLYVKTKGLKGKEKQEVIDKTVKRDGNYMALGCDNVTKENDGYHYTMTLAWQETGMPSDSDYWTGRLTMVSDDKFLEPGKVYMFDEKGLRPLNMDRYSSLKEGGADITGVDKDCFEKAGPLIAKLFQTALRISDDQTYGKSRPKKLGCILSIVPIISFVSFIAIFIISSIMEQRDFEDAFDKLKETTIETTVYEETTSEADDSTK